MADEDLQLENLAGVGPITKTRLVEKGIYTVLDLAYIGASEVAEAANLDLSKAIEMCNNARKKLVGLGLLDNDFVSADKLYKKRLEIDRISTGSSNLDDLLGGGIETGSLTEFYGEFGSGKTQICHCLCVMAQFPKEQGGLDASSIYVDTENTFRPERLAGVAEIRGLDPDAALRRVTVAKAYNSAHQELIVRELGRVIREKSARLVIIDSVVAHYRAEFLGRATLADRQQRINRFMHHLLRMAEVYDCAVVMTNQVMAAPDVFFGDPLRPVGGHVLGHTSTYRIYLRKASKNRIAKMVDSPSHPERETVFVMNERGIDDPGEDSPVTQ